MEMNKLIFVVGPTATGKTDIAIQIAKKVNGDIIAADSRQVYKHMTIGSGKDIPSHATQKTIEISNYQAPITIYQMPETTIWGYDAVYPTEDWSVANFYNYSGAVIEYLESKQRLPIIVGGTGFYFQAIISPPASLGISPNQALRQKLAILPLEKLQDRLKKLNNEHFNKLNNSDKNNPRRLIRAIEIALDTNRAKQSLNYQKKDYQSLWIGLEAPNNFIDQRIEERVYARLMRGFENEIDFLIKNNYLNPNAQASTATGYKEWLDYKQQKITKQDAIRQWIKAEKQYARRQKTWFKKQPNITWFDAQDKTVSNSVVEFAKNWYAKNQ